MKHPLKNDIAHIGKLKKTFITITTTITILRPLDCVRDYPGEPVSQR